MPVNAFQLITGGNKLAAILAGAGVLVWVLAYIFIFVKGFQDKSYGIPALAITLNFTWEFIFLYIYPTNPPARFQDWLWLLFDLPNVYLLLRFGRNCQTIPEFRKNFFSLISLAFVLAFFGHIVFHQRYHDPDGTDAAYLINYLMSVLFVFFYFGRRQLLGIQVPGLSYAGAWAKLIGTLLIDIANVVIWIGHSGTHYFMIYLFIGIFIFDVWYLYLMHLSHRATMAIGRHTTARAVMAA